MDRHDYVANYDSSNISVVSGKGAQVPGRSPLPSAEPNGIVWDQAKLSLYVANEGSSTVSIVQGLKVTGTITGPNGIVLHGDSYDEATDQVFVSAQGSDKVYVYGSSVGSSGPVPSGTSCSAGDSPAWDAYDPVDHEVYVANQGAAVSGPDNQSLTILNGACKILAAVPLPSNGEPEGDAFDPVSNTVYVTDAVNDEVYVISGTKLVHTITNATFDAPYGVAFDPANGEMAVANSALNTVSFLSGYKVVGTATVGSGPFLFAYDPANVRLLVTNINSDNVTSMNAAAPTDEKANINIPVGLDPHGIAFDVTDSDVYVANVFSHNVTVITGTRWPRRFGPGGIRARGGRLGPGEAQCVRHELGVGQPVGDPGAQGRSYPFGPVLSRRHRHRVRRHDRSGRRGGRRRGRGIGLHRDLGPVDGASERIPDSARYLAMAGRYPLAE